MSGEEIRGFVSLAELKMSGRISSAGTSFTAEMTMKIRNGLGVNVRAAIIG